MNSLAPQPWREARTDDGSWTLCHPGHGQACHSLSGAWTQARERYASVIAELPAAILATKTVRLLDIGTGLGLNLAAALESCEARGIALDATSFEIDRAVLTTTLERARRGAPGTIFHRRILDSIECELRAGDGGGSPIAAANPGLPAHRLRLILGDARSTLGELSPAQHFDAVFLDPFSPRVDPPLWDEAFLAQVASRMAPGARLATYTTSLRVRAALARAGLAVGVGPRVGRKAAGTLASRGGDVPALDDRTRRKLARARAPA